MVTIDGYGEARDAILRYAAEIIDENGEAALRIKDVARCTGSSVSTIYHYFSSREGLVAAAQLERYTASLSAFAAKYEELVTQITTRDQLRALVLAMHREAFDPERAQFRLRRLNAVASVLGRPDLRERMAEVQDEMTVRYRAMFTGFQRKGWVRSDVDLTALSAWALGNVLGRSLIELGRSRVDGQEWNRVAEIAIMAAFFGEGTEPADPAHVPVSKGRSLGI